MEGLKWRRGGRWGAEKGQSALSDLDFLPQKTRGAEQVAGVQRAAAATPTQRSRGDPAELPLESLPDGGAIRWEAAGEHVFEGAVTKLQAAFVS